MKLTFFIILLGLVVVFAGFSSGPKGEGSPAVLFSATDWCLTCRAATADIAPRLAKHGDIPIFILDFDPEKELKAMYNVTYKRTFVKINGDGEAVAPWTDSGADHLLGNVTRLEMN